MTEIYRQRDIWNTKPILKKVYEDIHLRMMKFAGPGPSLEIGSGGINLCKDYEDTIHTDIQNVPWVDVVSDAHKLPFLKDTFNNILMEEAQRVLKKGGRIIMVEPAITFFSRFFYKYFHSEPIKMNIDVFITQLSTEDPYDSNQAIPTLLFKDRNKFENKINNFKIINKKEFGLFVYPLSGGFRSWSLLPVYLYPFVFKIETYFEKLLSPYMGFRLLIVLEKIK